MLNNMWVNFCNINILILIMYNLCLNFRLILISFVLCQLITIMRINHIFININFLIFSNEWLKILI